MKTFKEIYSDIKQNFFNKTKLEIQPGTTIDSYILASSEGLAEAHKIIEANKNPHLYTGLKGDNLDELGFFLQCPRFPNEEDNLYLYRLMNWKLQSEASNSSAIELALMNMVYASNVAYVPLTHGTSTATAYIIPKSYEGDTPDKAIYETISRLDNVVSPSTFISYVIPKPKKLKFVFYISSEQNDIEIIKDNIKKKIADHVNGIAPGDYLDITDINRIGINESKSDYFRVAQVYINDDITDKLKLLQTIESKFLFEDIIWWTAVK